MCGAEPLGKPENYGFNTSQCSDGSLVEFIFDYGSLQNIRTPEGQITPFGSIIWHKGTATLEKAIVDEFKLIVKTPRRNDNTISQWDFQVKSSGPVYNMSEPV